MKLYIKHIIMIGFILFSIIYCIVNAEWLFVFCEMALLIMEIVNFILTYKNNKKNKSNEVKRNET